jgi:hypothetical protein
VTEARCPRCQTPLRADQDWCLECGAAARTRIASTPNWRAPVAGLALLIAIAGAAAAFAFVRLADTDDDLQAAKSAATLTQPPAATPPATTQNPVDVPPATTPEDQPSAPRPSPFTETTP